MRPEELLDVARRACRFVPVHHREDATGAALVRLVERAPESPALAWKVARDAAIDHLRAEKARVAAIVPVDGEAMLRATGDAEARAVAVDALERALPRLSPYLQRIVELVVAGYSDSEVAAMLGVRVDAAARARRRAGAAINFEIRMSGSPVAPRHSG